MRFGVPGNENGQDLSDGVADCCVCDTRTVDDVCLRLHLHKHAATHETSASHHLLLLFTSRWRDVATTAVAYRSLQFVLFSVVLGLFFICFALFCFVFFMG